MRPHIGRLLPTRLPGSEITIRINSDGLLEWRGPAGEYAVLTDLSSIAGFVLHWVGETGLDGLAFERREPDMWLIRGWQCKGGRGSVTITGGALETSLSGKSGLLTRRNVGGLDDSSIHAVSVKAMVGFCEIVNALKRTLPGVVVVPASLLITTTKNATLAQSELARWRGEFRIPRAVWTLCAPAVDAASRGIMSASPVAVTLLDGPSWANACVDGAVTRELGELAPLSTPLGPQAGGSGGKCCVM